LNVPYTALHKRRPQSGTGGLFSANKERERSIFHLCGRLLWAAFNRDKPH